MREYQICTNCVMDTSDSKIVFDESGVCDHCNSYYQNILPNWHTDERGQRELKTILDKIKADGKNKPFDCMMGLSGGLDSSYLAYLAVKEWGLRPKFITVNTHWNMPLADENIQKLADGLAVEFETITINWEELKDLHTAYFKSQVPYQDIPQDAAIFAASYNYAAKIKARYFLNGGNHSTECIRPPVEWAHVNDVRQMRHIHRKFGTIPLKKYPLLGFFKKNIYYRFFKKMHIIKPLNYVEYNKQEAINLLSNEFGWQPYQHKHYESRFTRFVEGYYMHNKFGMDNRRSHYSSLIVTKQITRNEVLEMLKSPPYDETEAIKDLEIIANKLDMTKDEFITLMNQPNKSWKDYKSGKAMVELALKLARVVGMERRNYR